VESCTARQWDRDGGAVSALAKQSETIDDLPWYAVQVRQQFEKKTDALLRSKGISTFLPLLRQIHQWSDRRKRVAVPLFPGYDFVHLGLSAESHRTVLQTAGVIAFVGPHLRPVSVPASQIEGLQRILRTDVDCAIRPFLHGGQHVRIRGGALDGLVGILVETTRKQIVISIECIQRSVCVAIEGYDLEVI
jgi:transcription termination/antitermination protein NusG